MEMEDHRCPQRIDTYWHHRTTRHRSVVISIFMSTGTRVLRATTRSGGLRTLRIAMHATRADSYRSALSLCHTIPTWRAYHPACPHMALHYWRCTARPPRGDDRVDDGRRSPSKSSRSSSTSIPDFHHMVRYSTIIKRATATTWNSVNTQANAQILQKQTGPEFTVTDLSKKANDATIERRPAQQQQ